MELLLISFLLNDRTIGNPGWYRKLWLRSWKKLTNQCNIKIIKLCSLLTIDIFVYLLSTKQKQIHAKSKILYFDSNFGIFTKLWLILGSIFLNFLSKTIENCPFFTQFAPQGFQFSYTFFWWRKQSKILLTMPWKQNILELTIT